VEQVSKIQLGPDLRPKERNNMRIYFVSISICLFLATRTLGKSPWSNTKLNYCQMLNQLGPSKGDGIQNTL
jgi:hypothetical protein